MIEIEDNTIQLMVMIVCCINAVVLFIRTREQVWFLLTCFYSAFALGLIHWLLFIVFFSSSPKISPVSDLWLASLLFLSVLQSTMRLPGENMYRPILAWTAPVFSVFMYFFFFRWGDYFLNVLWTIIMGTCGYLAIRACCLHGNM